MSLVYDRKLLNNNVYRMVFREVKLNMHMGGTFINNPLRYVGGEINEWMIDPDYIGYHTFLKLVHIDKYKDVSTFSYCEPGLSFEEGIRVCYDNDSFIAMINHALHLGEFDVYVDHGVSQPEVGDNALLLPSSQVEKKGPHEDRVGEKKPKCWWRS